jgi:hypothetical protein
MTDPPVSPATTSKSKRKAKSAGRAHWTDKDVRNLLDFLMEHKAKAGDGANFTKTTWQAAAAELGKIPPEKGAPKTPDSCKSKWTKVSSLSQYTQYLELILRLS